MHQHTCPSGHGAFDLSVIEFALRFGKTFERFIFFTQDGQGDKLFIASLS